MTEKNKVQAADHGPKRKPRPSGQDQARQSSSGTEDSPESWRRSPAQEGGVLHSASEPRIVYRRRSVSWIWIVPIVAALAGLSMVVRTWMMIGPSVVITFATGEGIEVGKTQVRYKEVAIGVVDEVRLSEDRSRVEVRASLNKDAQGVAREGSRFWIVRPRLALSGVSGLGTLMSGVYIAVDIPDQANDAASRHEFIGLESPPQVASGRSGTRYIMRAESLGSLDIGSPVYFRHVRAGQVVGYQLSQDGRHVDIQVFVDAPFNRFVSSNTRFWNASGLDVSMSASGFDVQMQSLTTVLAGGLAFEDVLDAGAEPIAPHHVFELFDNEREARHQIGGVRVSVQFRVDGSVRGVTRGTEVDFRGLSLGSITGVRLGFDPKSRNFYALLDAEIYPERFGDVYLDVKNQPDGEAHFWTTMIKNGLHAQLRTSNFLTGQNYVALDFLPKASPAADFHPEHKPYLIPVVPGTFDQVPQQIASIVTKLDRLPLDDMGRNMQTILRNASSLLTRLDKNVAPELAQTLKQARDTLTQVDILMSSGGAMTGHVERAMHELARAARSLRELTDGLHANPGTLIRGRASDPQLFEEKR